MSESNQNYNRGGNRNRQGNRNRNNRRGGSGRGRQRPTKLSLWQKVLKAIGLYKPKSGGNRSSRDRGAQNARSRDDGSQRRSKPERVEVDGPRLYVGNLSYDSTNEDLEELFSEVGTVSSVDIIFNRHSGRSKGYGFIEMSNIDEAKQAMETFQDKSFMGRKLVVNGAKAKQRDDYREEPTEEEPTEEESTEEESEY
ncbi:MAG: RNA-binding protein [Opitutaceae bacterium]|nr:RNA-binding protein [Opitutaceae bacterium]